MESEAGANTKAHTTQVIPSPQSPSFTAQAVEFLQNFFAGTTHNIELRAFAEAKKGARQVFTRDCRVLEKFIADRVSMNENVYFGLCTREGNAGAKDNCRELVALWADVDLKRATDGFGRISNFSPRPSLIVSSGGGFHVYWLLSAPVDAHDRRVEPILKAVASAIGADEACAELARVLRVPGTRNFKKKYEVPPNVFAVRADWTRRYELVDFSNLAHVSCSKGNGSVRATEAAGEHSVPEGQRNSVLTSLAGTMRRRGMSETAVLAALLKTNEESCLPPLPEHEVEVIAKSVGRYAAANSPAGSVNSNIPTREVTRVPVIENEDRLTEAGAAERFARLHGGDVRFDHRRGLWLVWDGHRWRPDTDAAVTRLALDFARTWQYEALGITNLAAREAALKAVLRLEKRDALNNMLALAHDLKPIADAGDSWDLDPYVLGVPNGVVDLRSGELRAGRRQDKITLSTSVAYDSDARSDLWENALKAILLKDELIGFFQAAVGYSATGDTSLDRWFLGSGEGRNGKGTLAHPIRHALGDYALELPASVFDLKADRAPYELARLPGRRLVMSSESGDTIRLNHDRIKQISGGDPMSAANKYERPFEFQPISKLWIFCNRRPRVTDDTIAFWSRVLLLPFVVSFAGREDHALRPKLTQDPTHQAAVLSWIVFGAVRYLNYGLGPPPEAVLAATKEYKDDQDVLAPFLEQACDLDPDSEIGASDLYQIYTRWADRQHLTTKERMTATKFGRIVSGRFKSRKDRITGVKLYSGITSRGLF